MRTLYSSKEQSLGLRRANLLGAAGNRSSVDEGRGDGGPEDETVVEPDQGNGQSKTPLTAKHQDTFTDVLRGCSALTYHKPAAARRRSKSSCATYFHPRASKYAGENHKVRMKENSAPLAFTDFE